MGQYYVVANLTKKEYLDPHAFGNGVKLMEFGMDGRSVMTGLAVLLASSNGAGGGDLHLPDKSAFADIPGRWAGDRIVVAGDYDTNPDSPGCQVYSMCGSASPLEELANTVEPTGMFTDISYLVLGCLLEDEYFRNAYVNVKSPNATWNDFMKKNRRDAWQKARPNDPVPESLT